MTHPELVELLSNQPHSQNSISRNPATNISGKLILDNSRWEKRLQKELMSLMREPPPGVTVDADLASQNLQLWIINMEGVPGTLYEGEQFQLQFKFTNKYPFDSPEVTFIGNNIPVHPHVYSNGHICLSILTDDWSPALSVQSVCLSIVSMLSSCKEKKRPPDNSFYVKTCNKNPKKTKWWYHGKNAAPRVLSPYKMPLVFEHTNVAFSKLKWKLDVN